MSVSLPLSASRRVSTSLPALVMGILNITGDSFWEGSRTTDAEDAVARALAMVESGADIIDIGAESTRPGAQYVSEEEEIERLLPVISLIRKETSVPISVDTRKSSVLRRALDCGADILNDISAMQDDPDIARIAAESDIPVVLMHKKGTPGTMQDSPRYTDVVEEVREYLFARAAAAEKEGISRDKIILDSGIGFGKDLNHNISLISGLAKIAAGGYPVLMALSRKSCIGMITGKEPQDRMAGTLAANLISVKNGATLLRVHDVAETVDMLKVVQEIDITWNS